ncbi:MAG: hypothetical protein IT428_06185 [Planctomycetaceae bacterium]|nr:hypothetical protein [Planctomycetaceae bacterium]
MKLRAVRDGRDWFTCLEWIQEFMEACTRQAMPESKADAQFTAWSNEQSKRRLKERYGINVDPNAAAYLAELEAEIAAEGQVPDVRKESGTEGTLPRVLPIRAPKGRVRKSDVGGTRKGRAREAATANSKPVGLVESSSKPPEETRD